MRDAYREFEPGRALARYAACLWTFHNGDEPADPTPQRIVPDGCCELVVHHGAPYAQREADGDWRVQASAVFAGQLTRPLHLRATGRTGTTAVRFRPAGARAFTGRTMAGLTDRIVPLEALHGEDASRLVERVVAAPDAETRIALVAAYVAARVASPPDPAVEQAVEAIRASEGRIGIGDLSRLTGLTSRTLQRRFADEVGVSPRLLASVARFRRVFNALAEENGTSWTAAAQAAGYFDHPQMARDFRRFVGCTPTEFLAVRGGLAASMVDLAPA